MFSATCRPKITSSSVRVVCRCRGCVRYLCVVCCVLVCVCSVCGVMIQTLASCLSLINVLVGSVGSQVFFSNSSLTRHDPNARGDGTSGSSSSKGDANAKYISIGVLYCPQHARLSHVKPCIVVSNLYISAFLTRVALVLASRTNASKQRVQKETNAYDANVAFLVWYTLRRAQTNYTKM